MLCGKTRCKSTASHENNDTETKRRRQTRASYKERETKGRTEQRLDCEPKRSGSLRVTPGSALALVSFANGCDRQKYRDIHEECQSWEGQNSASEGKSTCWAYSTQGTYDVVRQVRWVLHISAFSKPGPYGRHWFEPVSTHGYHQFLLRDRSTSFTFWFRKS